MLLTGVMVHRCWTFCGEQARRRVTGRRTARRRSTYRRAATARHRSRRRHGTSLRGNEAELREHDEQHEVDVANLQRAVESRDLIGQAKGIIMATMRWTADEAFALIVQQSQAENRKVTEIAMDIVRRATRRPPRTD